jgi:hypothetical protein
VTPTRYENIRNLDDQENWGERTAVVFKADHDENVINAQAILLDLLNDIFGGGGYATYIYIWCLTPLLTIFQLYLVKFYW